MGAVPDCCLPVGPAPVTRAASVGQDVPNPAVKGEWGRGYVRVDWEERQGFDPDVE